ncbi:MAG: response regulator [Melioribacteraceae bacterium]|nr:response regulator [Melioribacteraceae bacterium]
MESYDVLVIDDEEVIIDFMLKIGDAEKYFIDTALTGQEGLDKLINGKYKLVICDLILPDMDGFDIISKSVKENVTTPIIVSTGYSTIENAIKAMNSGAIDFLPKPFTYDEIVCCIRKGLRYSSILYHHHANHEKNRKDEMSFIPCPPSYYRFGLSSWVKIESDGIVITGLTDLMLRTIESVDAVNTLDIEQEVFQGKEYMSIDCPLGLDHKVLSPVSGKILEVNRNIIEDSKLVEKDPFFDGWVYKILPGNLTNEIQNLMSCSTDRV